jgi:hypothetical protein
VARAGCRRSALAGVAIEDPLAQQIELRAAVHTPRDQFEPVDLSFRLPLTPGERQASHDSSLVLLQFGDEGGEFRPVTCRGIRQPLVQVVTAVGANHLREAMQQRASRVQLRMELAQHADDSRLFTARALGMRQQQSEGAARRQARRWGWRWQSRASALQAAQMGDEARDGVARWPG